MQQPQRQKTEQEQAQLENQEQFFEGEDEEQDLMDDPNSDMASSDSELQVQDPSQQIFQDQNQGEKQEDDDPMKQYYDQENLILEWLASNPGQKWVDKDFPMNSSQFYEDSANLPKWGCLFKNLEWKRPEQIIKDPKFMICEEDKNGKSFEIDAKHGLFGASWFISALTMVGTKTQLLEKLIIEKQYFDRGFVSFQFFKNGKWSQVIVDTLLPYQREGNNRTCIYSSCSNLQQFWIQLIQKAYVKLHGNYEKITKGNILEGLVDLNGGISESLDLQGKSDKKQINALWNSLSSFYQQKFILGAINSVDERGLKDAEQGQQGILENHYYAIIDMRDFPKDNLKLIRLRNPWGSEGVWTGPFCQEADDWQKYKNVKEDVKNAIKTKKSDGSWWMSFTDFVVQFDRVAICKIFPENWELYSIQSQWTTKTNGGKCPIPGMDKNLTNAETKDAFKLITDHSQPESDDKWFNNPQFRLKVLKDTKIYISLMLEDEKISNQSYVSMGFMIAVTKSRTERFWQRPPQEDIIAQINYDGHIGSHREVTHYLTLKKNQKAPAYYMIIPNINDSKDVFKKEDFKRFFLRLFTPECIDVTELSQTLEHTVEGQWTQSSAGGSRKVELKEDGGGKKKGDIKDNPNWCKNPQYFVTIKQPTLVKVILRKLGTKKYKGWKIGMSVCRYEMQEERKTEKQTRKQKKGAGHNIQRLIQQTSQFLQPPIIRQAQRKNLIQPHEKFKESIFASQEYSALFFKWNPTEGPFIIIPSSDGQERVFGYKLTIFSNHPVEMMKLDQTKNQAIVGKWEKDITAGGCHLNEKDREPSQRTWSMNPKYHLSFKEEETLWDDPINLKITLAIAEKNWKKLNPNTVNGMIGLYLLQKREGKLSYSPQTVVNQTSFLPVKEITMETVLGGENPLLKNGYIIMPSTYQSKVQGSFILSVKCDRPFELTQSK